MVVGSGLIARAFYDSFISNEDVIIFASGVSNSQEVSIHHFLREENLLKESLNRDKKIIYFSTCSIQEDTLSLSPYVIHKINMEKMITSYSLDYLIFRLPQVAGFTENPHTLLNYFFNNIRAKKVINIYESARRNIIDIEDIAKICLEIISNNHTNKTINIANSNSVPPLEILRVFENILHIDASFVSIPGGSTYEIDTSFCSKIASKINIDFSNSYLENVIRKYYQYRI